MQEQPAAEAGSQNRIVGQWRPKPAVRGFYAGGTGALAGLMGGLVVGSVVAPIAAGASPSGLGFATTGALLKHRARMT